MNKPAATTLNTTPAAIIAVGVAIVVVAVVATPIEGAGLVLATTD